MIETTIYSQYTTYCYVCLDRIKKGDSVAWRRRRGVRHPECYDHDEKIWRQFTAMLREEVSESS